MKMSVVWLDRISICLLFFISCVVCSSSGRSSRDSFQADVANLISTRQGNVRGEQISYASRDATSSSFQIRASVYKGIPFASPPLASLRFMPPVTSSPWTGVRDAKTFAPVCPQSFPPEIRNRSLAMKTMTEPTLREILRRKAALRNQSEDCLYLNVYVPVTGNINYRSGRVGNQARTNYRNIKSGESTN
jgi:neuroligin